VPNASALNAEDGDRLVVLGELIDQIAGGPSGESLGRHQRAVMPLRPAVVLQRFAETFFFDVEKFVEGPRRTLIIFDRQCSERNVILAMRVIDRAARIPVHAGDFAVVVLVVGENILEVAGFQFLARFLQYNRPELIEELTFVKAILAIAARVCDRLVEIVEHHFLLRNLLVLRRGTLRLVHCRLDGVDDLISEYREIGCFADGRNRAVGGRDVDDDEESAFLRRVESVVS
jgi:hypothetical protein